MKLGHSLRIDYKKIGKNITAYVLVKATGNADQKELLDLIVNLPGVYEAAMITGEFDIIFKARAASMEELNSLVVQRLKKFKSIHETRTMISYETIENSIV